MKKPACLILIAFVFSNALFAQDSETKNYRPKVDVPFFFVSNFNVDVPNKNVMPNMPVNVGFGINATFFPFKDLPLGIDARGGFGWYASHKEMHTFDFNNTSTEIEVKTDGKFNRALLGLKLIDYQSNKLVKPFLVGHMGFGSFRSHVYFPNENDDDDDCVPMNQELVHKSNGLIYGAEAGLELYLLGKGNRIVSRGEGVFASISFGFLSSNTNFSYINPKHMHNNHTQPTNGGQQRQGRGQEIQAPFINVSSSEIHYHKVADLYISQLLIYTLSAGVIFRF